MSRPQKTSIQRSILAILTISATMATLTATADAKSKTYAVIVSNNTSVDAGVAALRYADDDGARYYELFNAVADEVHLLTTLDRESQVLFEGLNRKTRPPSRAVVLETLRGVNASIKADEAAGVDTTLFVIFVGHGAVDDDGMGYLSLSDARLTRDDLHEEVIQPASADRTHVIIDACHAYFLVNARGDDRSGETYDDELMAFLEKKEGRRQGPKVGFFLSTSGAAEVHEWSRYGSGVFSHQIRSGLLGGADANGDSKVNYQELEAYLAAANARIKNARARIHFFAKPPEQERDAPLLSFGRARRTTMARFERPGRYYIEDSRGVRYADFHTAGDSPVHIALLWDHIWRSPHYFVRTEEGEVKIAPDDGEGGVVEIKALEFVALSGASRGSVDEAYRRDLYAAPYGKGFFEGYQAHVSRTGERGPTVINVDDGVLDAFGWRLSYYASPAPFDLAGLQHNVATSADFWFGELLGLSAFGEYGTSGHEAVNARGPFRLHRAVVGVGLSTRLPLPAGFALGGDLRTGHQWLVHDGADALSADALSLRTQLDASLTYALSDGVSVGVRGGASADVLTDDSGERLELLPYAGAVFELRR